MSLSGHDIASVSCRRLSGRHLAQWIQGEDLQITEARDQETDAISHFELTELAQLDCHLFEELMMKQSLGNLEICYCSSH